MTDSKGKGDRGEREIAKLMKEWWGAEFARTPQSGGFHTKRFRRDWNAEGDLATADSSFPFSVEVKHQEDWILDDLLTRPKSKVWDWWEQAKGQSDDKLTLLVFKRNYKPWFYMMRVQPEHTEYQKDFIKSSPMRIVDRQGDSAYIGQLIRLLAEPIEKWKK